MYASGYVFFSTTCGVFAAVSISSPAIRHSFMSISSAECSKLPALPATVISSTPAFGALLHLDAAINIASPLHTHTHGERWSSGWLQNIWREWGSCVVFASFLSLAHIADFYSYVHLGKQQFVFVFYFPSRLLFEKRFSRSTQWPQ